MATQTMLFDSVEFLFFLPVVLTAGWLLRGRPRQAFLLLASYTFYGAWDWRFLSLIGISTAVDYTVARLMDKDGISRRRRKVLVWTSVATNLGILGTFKYAGFFVESLVALAQTVGLNIQGTTLDIVLPVGISFYTFQTLGYTIDVYRGHAKAEKDLLAFALYVAWFPQLVAGPIERAPVLIPRLKAKWRLDARQFSDGVALILWGLFKKMVVADRVGLIANTAFATGPNASPASNGLESYLAVLAFAIQIYADFSGYTDVARGTSKLFGVDLMLNFRHPYLAVGPQDFWRRWHVSLSTWLRDYLYISLGGSRKSALSTSLNLLITMLLGGLWHGAAWHFVAWGAYHGGLLMLERMAGLARAPRAMWSHVLRVVIMSQLTLLGWLLFRAESVSQAWEMAWLIPAGSWAATARTESWLWTIGLVALPLVAMHVHQKKNQSFEPLTGVGNLGRFLFGLGVVVGLFVFRVQDRIEFIYFQF
jgi:D-alanyl-lipoteichoic acid acyltransferase DltB (MBOAT superfamily)